MNASSLVDPAILFFFLGMSAVLVKSDLEIPQPIPKLLSLYLLVAIGFKGGHELARGGMHPEVAITIALAVAMATAVPIYSYFILRRKLDGYNAAAIAAAYGSVSAVTFATAQTYLQTKGTQSGGHMVAAMALMESPAILIGIYLSQKFGGAGSGLHWKKLVREAFTNGSVYLLVGSLAIGFVSGDSGWSALKPFLSDAYKGALCLFLLDMGLIAAKRLGDLRKTGWHLIAFAVGMPVLNAILGMELAFIGGLAKGNAFLFTMLCGSASYIAVPAAMRLALPKANPGLYVSMPLAVTFPCNVLFGIPAYYWLIERFWG